MNKKAGIIVGVLIVAFVIGSLIIMSSDNDTDSSDTTTSEEVVTQIYNELYENTLTAPDLDVPTPSLEVAERPEFDGVTVRDDFATSTTTQVSVNETVTYSLPRGHEGTLQIDAEVENGVVSSLEIQHLNVTPASDEHHDAFDNANLEQTLIGQVLEDIEDVRISGATLTSQAFNEAVSALRSQV